MSVKKIRFCRVLINGLAAAAIALCGPALCRADFIVADGWDLFATTSVTVRGFTFDPQSIGSFDFGLFGGTRPNLGDSDSFINSNVIVRRATDAIAAGQGGTGASVMRLAEMRFRTAAAVDFDPGNPGADDVLFLRPVRVAGVAVQPAGTNAITFTDAAGSVGTYDYNVPFDYEIRRADPDSGAVVFTGPGLMLTDDASWTESALGPDIFDNVNHFLKGDGSDDQDFFAIVQPTFLFDAAAVPEPALGITSGLAILGMGLMSLRRRLFGRKASCQVKVVS